MQKIFIDYVGKFPRSRSGNTAILVCVDAFSKFVWMFPVKQTSAAIRALKTGIFSSFSVPDVMVSDNAQCFVSREFKNFCFGLGIKHVTTSPYYTQPSQAERFNQNLRAALIAYHSDAQETWDKQLGWLQLASNTAEHESTKTTPFAVIFPFRSGSPLLSNWKISELLPDRINQRDLRRRWSDVKRNLTLSQNLVAQRYNQGRVPQPFQVGDMVYYKNHPISRAGRHLAAKLMPRYKSTFRVDVFLTPVTVHLVHPVSGRFVSCAHVSLLKPGT
jgi:hypothetical protein